MLSLTSATLSQVIVGITSMWFAHVQRVDQSAFGRDAYVSLQFCAI